MKKLALSMLFLFIFAICGTAFAQEAFDVMDVLGSMPPMKQGVAYSFLDKEFNYTSTFVVKEWKDFSIEAGYNSKQAIIGAVAIDLLALKDYTSIPILDLLRLDVRLYGGYKRLGITEGNNEIDYGVGWTIIKVDL